MDARYGPAPCPSRDEAPHPGLAAARGVDYLSAMNQRSRKALGTFGTVAFIIVYALAAMAIGGEIAVGRGMAIELAFFVVAGLLWLPVVMSIIRWMVKPDET